jgi:hypothetical protein
MARAKSIWASATVAVQDDVIAFLPSEEATIFPREERRRAPLVAKDSQKVPWSTIDQEESAAPRTSWEILREEYLSSSHSVEIVAWTTGRKLSIIENRRGVRVARHRSPAHL